MKRTILMPIVTIALCAAVLAGTSLALSGAARENGKHEHIQIMQTLLPGSENFVLEPYSGDDANIVSVHKGETGFVIETVTQGYVDGIRMLIGVSNDGKVVGLVVREAHETYGLGSRILTDHEFLAQFLNKSGSFEIATQGADAFSGATAEVATDGEAVSVDGITGATVSSKAVVRCVNSAVAYVTGADAVSTATTWGG